MLQSTMASSHMVLYMISTGLVPSMVSAAMNFTANTCNLTGSAEVLLDDNWHKTDLVRFIENGKDMPFCTAGFDWHVRNETERPIIGCLCSLIYCCWESLGKLQPGDLPDKQFWKWESCHAKHPKLS